MLKRTPFYEMHVAAGARLIDFGGFEMPVQYSGIIKEHEAVRTSAGIFDVSHMGEFRVTGPKAFELIQLATINDASKLYPGKVQYTAMCYENGGIVDDLLVYMLAEDDYLLVVNASNIDKDLEWLTSLNNSVGAIIQNLSDEYCLLAVQGPAVPELLQPLTDLPLSEIGFYTFQTGNFAGFDNVIVSATGYTGEKGFEIYFKLSESDPKVIWDAILDCGEGGRLIPAGLGARDTLRLEMGYALYGNDISAETSPLEAGLSWVTKLDKGEFSGRAALLTQKESGVKRKLNGFLTDDRRAIPRNGYILTDASGDKIGEVTSGGSSPTLGKGIGMGYIDTTFDHTTREAFIEIRGKLFPIRITRPPFIKKN